MKFVIEVLMRDVPVRRVLPLVTRLADVGEVRFDRSAHAIPGVIDVVSLRGWLENPRLWVAIDAEDRDELRGRLGELQLEHDARLGPVVGLLEE